MNKLTQYIAYYIPLLFYTNITFASYPECIVESASDLSYKTKAELIHDFCNSKFLAKTSNEIAGLSVKIGDRKKADDNWNDAHCYNHNAETAWLVLRKEHGLKEKPDCN